MEDGGVEVKIIENIFIDCFDSIPVL